MQKLPKVKTSNYDWHDCTSARGGDRSDLSEGTKERGHKLPTGKKERGGEVTTKGMSD